MFAEIFNSTVQIDAPATFGLGVLPSPRSPLQYDEMGNRLPLGPSDADRAWYQADLQRRMDAQSEAAERESEMEAMRLDALEAEWLASIEWRERSDMPAGYFS